MWDPNAERTWELAVIKENGTRYRALPVIYAALAMCHIGPGRPSVKACRSLSNFSVVEKVRREPNASRSHCPAVMKKVGVLLSNLYPGGQKIDDDDNDNEVLHCVYPCQSCIHPFTHYDPSISQSTTNESLTTNQSIN